ncbi:hypothetical protein RhiirC2_759649, partial [Rhizophagus irregularis]
MPKKVIDREFEEPIKNQSEQRKKEQTKKKKKRGKEAIKEIALPQPVDQQPVVKNSRGVCATSRDIMFYDIPARYSESEVISAIKNIGNIHRIRIKKHYKYQSGADDTWIIHGKSLGNQPTEISKRDSRSDLVSTTPRINGKATPAKNKQATATSTIMDNLNTDEVVDVVNKYRKNLLDETPQNVASTSIKDYTSPEKVVDVVLDLRAEIKKELSQDENEDESWIERCRNGKKKVDDVRVACDTIKNELEVVQNKVNENQKILDKIRSEKEKEAKSNENVKQ